MGGTKAMACALGFGLLCAMGALPGCGSHRGGTVVISDDSDQRLSKAMELARRAQDAQKAGRDEEAIALYRQSLDQSRTLASVWNNLGLLLMKRGDRMDAADMFRAAADVSPTDPKPYLNVALAYDEAGWSERALEYYIKSLERDPRYIDALRGAAQSARLLQMADEACLERVRSALLLETDPKWRAFFQREQLRIEGRMSNERLMRAEVTPSTPVRMGEIPATPAPK